MENINKLELQNIKMLLQQHEIAYQKFKIYSLEAVDPQIKQILINKQQDSLNIKQKLMSFLNI